MSELFSNFTCAVREWLFIPQAKSQIVDAIYRSEERIKADVFACIERLVPQRTLATLTVLCDVESLFYDGNSLDTPKTKKERSVMGGEVFLMPGDIKDIRLTPQRPISNMTFFVSGHPNIVIKGFKVGNYWCCADQAGKKFGEVNREVRPGYVVDVVVEYVTDRQ